MKFLHCLALLLVIIGAVNWALIGLFNFDVVFEICDAVAGGGELELSSEGLTAEMPGPGEDGMYLAQRIIYIVVGASGVLLLLGFFHKGKGSCAAS